MYLVGFGAPSSSKPQSDVSRRWGSTAPFRRSRQCINYTFVLCCCCHQSFVDIARSWTPFYRIISQIIDLARRRRTFAAPTATIFRVNYANIHATYRRRRRINAIHWLDRPIASLCSARYDLHRNWQHTSCHFDHVLLILRRTAPGRTIPAATISTNPNHRRCRPRRIPIHQINAFAR